MEIKIKADTSTKETEIIFSNENLDNYNFVDLITDNEEYTLSLDDLMSVVKAFNEKRKLN